jgi:DNA-binding MarR family transcriptional regulator
MPEPSALVDAVRALSRVSRVVERETDELSVADYRVLSTIVSGEGRASRLAARLALGKPTISASVESLVKRGLLVRSSVRGDNRAIALSLTEDGAELLDRVETRMARQLELLCERTPDAQRVVDSLCGLGDAIEAAVAERLQRVERAERAEAAAPADRVTRTGDPA